MTHTTPENITSLHEQDEHKDLLRLVTAGSVDDGKSTLIGRLLFESKGIYEDQLEAVRSASGQKGSTQGDLDLALVTDGLKAEREQGITIDVAYRYFSTPRRKFIIADSPGHEQYTRNMVTGASTANLAIILIDASQGVLTQSRRHAFLASLLGIPHAVITINKMDLVDFSEKVYDEIVADFREFSAKLDIQDLTFIPISALTGDNVVERGENMPWYEGTTLLNHLETVHIASDRNLIDLRLPIQYVSRPHSDFRGYMGTLASGIIRAGDEVMTLPSGKRSSVTQVIGPDGPCEEGFPPLPVTVTLADEIDISRGDMLVHVHNTPQVDRDFEAMVVWMAEEPMDTRRQYTIKHTSRLSPGQISKIRYRIDVNTLHRLDATTLELNEIGRCTVEVARPLAFDPYRENRTTGAFIIIDRVTHNTVGAGMILDRKPGERELEAHHRVTETRARHLQLDRSLVPLEERNARSGQRPVTVWLTGLMGSGKSTIGCALERRLFDDGRLVTLYDGENTRLGLNKDLDFTADDRAENARRAAEVAKLFNEAGMISVSTLLSPCDEDRKIACSIVGEDRFILIYLSTPVEVCKERAPHRIYEKAENGEIKVFPGVNAPYEVPESPDLVLPTHEISVAESVDRIVTYLEERGVFEA